MNSHKTSILIIYTGGTIGMVNDPETGSLRPFDFDHIVKQVPELKEFGFNLQSIAFDPLIDSSDLSPQVWVQLANLIKENYNIYDGFVVLHGTDTMSYSASAISFMLDNLQKPVIFTGSQLPIGTLRTDGKENLITAIEIAATHKNGQALVPEVCVLFENKLFRGNRTTKHNAEHFNAFDSYNYPHLAEVGIHIHYNYAAIHYPSKNTELSIATKMDTNVAILKIFPGITPEVVNSILNIKGLKGVILETYGSGNAPTQNWFIQSITEALQRNIIIFNVTQCKAGSVEMGRYATSVELAHAGVISGHDITTEAAITKMMYLLGKERTLEKTKFDLNNSLKGEISK